MNGKDRVVWDDSKNGVLFVKSFYFVLKLESLIPFPMGIILNSWVLSKVIFLLGS